jgi:hypothetical protein
MFPLNTTTFPSSASDLERLLNHSLQRIFSVEADPVSIRDASYPQIEEIRVALDRARLRSHPPQPPSISGKISPALQADRLCLSALAFSVGPATIDLSLSARTVTFVQGRDSDGQVVLSLENAADGKIAISAAQTDLESLVTTLAQNQAARQGITIDDVQLKLRQKNAHSLAAEARLRARRLFLSASIQVTGQLDLDDQLNLKISDLICTGDGGIATLACGILKPYLQKIDGREFPLMSLPLGNIRLRDVSLTVGDKLCVTAEFGSGVA